MKIHSLHSDIEPEQGDYFFASSDENNTLKITLTSNNRRPLSLRRVPRRLVYQLISSLQSTMLAQDEKTFEPAFTPPADPELETLLQEIKNVCQD